MYQNKCDKQNRTEGFNKCLVCQRTVNTLFSNSCQKLCKVCAMKRPIVDVWRNQAKAEIKRSKTNKPRYKKTA